MKTFKELWRQPLKTLVGITLMVLAAAIVCLCVGQAVAAYSTKQTLDQRFSTVGIPIVREETSGNVTTKYYMLEDEFLQWLETVAEENPDIVKQVARHGLLSAYIPQMTPMNPTQEKYSSNSKLAPYSCAMLVITLEEVGEPTEVTTSYRVENLTSEDFDTLYDYYEWLFDPETERVTAIQGYSVKISGTVTDVVSLADGYRDPVGRTARLTFTARTLDAVNSLNLVPGEQYIVYGMDYVDEYWKLIGTLNYSGKYDHVDLEPYDPELLRLLSEEEIRYYQYMAAQAPRDFECWVAKYNGIYLTEEEYLQLNAISLTLNMSVPQIEYEEIRDEETGKLLEVRPKTEVTCTDWNGETYVYSIEEYSQRYRIPTIAKLDGTIEEFLNSKTNTEWKTAFTQSAINNQAFTVIGVDRMDYLADFSLRRSQIVKGRDFTEEERTGGSRVCIIHESLAKANGLEVGDTITLNLYQTDFSLPYQTPGKLRPFASFNFSTNPFTETAEYTIVGLWQGQAIWNYKENDYAFTPNTVFVPRSSVNTTMHTNNSVQFTTVVPHNGMITQFHDLTMQSGYAGRFRYNDQDYGTIAANFHNYESLAKQMLTIGIVLYSVLLLLFLLLYPGAQKRRARTMQSLGAGFMRRFAHTFASSIGIVIPASVLGGWIGTQLWDSLVSKLQATAESAVALQIEPGTLLQLSAAQLILAMLMTACVSAFVAAPRGISARR